MQYVRGWSEEHHWRVGEKTAGEESARVLHCFVHGTGRQPATWRESGDLSNDRLAEKTGRAGSFVGLVSPPSNPKLQACDSQVRKELGPRLPEGRGDVGWRGDGDGSSGQKLVGAS